VIVAINMEMSTSYIYVIGSDSPPYKVGISKAPDQRLKALQTGHPRKLRIHSLRETNAEKTKLLESVIHHHLKHYKTHGEWFDISLEDAILEVEYALMRWEDDPTLRSRVKEKWL
jgi:hypothetical protein